MFINSLFTHLSALKTRRLMILSIIIYHCFDICHSIWFVMIFLRIVVSLIFEILNVNFIFEFNSCASVIFIWISSWTTSNWAFVHSNSCWQILMITLVKELSYQCFDDCVENSAKIKDILIWIDSLRLNETFLLRLTFIFDDINYLMSEKSWWN